VIVATSSSLEFITPKLAVVLVCQKPPLLHQRTLDLEDLRFLF
jgi:hypothetical protein